MKFNAQQQSLFDATPTVYHAEMMLPDEKEKLESNAINQEFRVLSFLRFWSPKGYGASKIWMEVRSSEFEPLTSIRRALTNLEKQGKVVKLKTTEKGLFGKQEHLWVAR